MRMQVVLGLIMLLIGPASAEEFLETMKVHFVESGGFVGLLKECELDTAAITPEMARELKRLVEESGLAVSGEFFSDAGRDLRQYEITIEDGTKKISVTFDDENIPQSAKPLLGYLKKCAKPKCLE
jgi:emfourin